ncbi:MAG: ABC transporter transmembrane domain-containing protein [Alphaproteobacteria bacterium]|nr:ABC transporter transmembrane domain-containing protein [Alphaproteobacteria bacterium]
MEADQAANSAKQGKKNDSKNAASKDGKAAKQDLGTLKSLIPLLKPYSKQMIFALLGLVVAASATLGIGTGVKGLIDTGFGKGNAELLNQTLVILFLVIVVMSVASFARFYYVSWVGERVVADLRRKIFRHLLQLTPSYYETAQSGDLISRMNTDTSLLQVVIGSSVSVAMRNVLLLLGGSVMMFVSSPKLAVMAFFMVPLVIVPIILLGRSVRDLSRQTQDRVGDISSGLEETIHGISTIQALTREDIISKNFNERVENAFKTSISRVSVRAWMIVAVITLVFGSVAILMWRGGHDVVAGLMTAGELSSFVFYAILVAGAAGAISEVFGDLQRAAGAIERISELLLVTSDIKILPKPLALPDPGYGKIFFDNVSFFYPSRPQAAAVDSFNLQVKQGEKIAIVGPSGAGKSTLFQLLLRFYDPVAGSIQVDGFNITEVHPRDLRRKIGSVPQDITIFSQDIMSNIRMGRPDATDEEVFAASTAARAHDFIMEDMPQKYQTFVGEKGVRLSGGQKQRIGIARAFLRNAPILLLDEATSALDSQNEKDIQKALAELMQNRTTLIIAHRLSTVTHCDRIIVMDKGQIVEQGNHEELMNKQGLYSKLAKIQLKKD